MSTEPARCNEFVITRRVQFVETDLAGVLHFSNYYRYMEEVECAFWRAQGLGVIYKDNDVEISWPRVATKCEYRAPARFEQELELALTVAHVGGRSVTYDVEFRGRLSQAPAVRPASCPIPLRAKPVR